MSDSEVVFGNSTEMGALMLQRCVCGKDISGGSQMLPNLVAQLVEQADV
ncbi:hypothetical protein [Calothrix sp. PCC 7507]|nr:hypothetical protein [Calothrix sp. PCC 7507]